MNNEQTILEGIGSEIKELLYNYIKAQSFTYTAREKEAEQFLMEHFSKIPYFQEHPEYYGTYEIEGDAFGRAVCYGMVKGEGSDTVVFVHHNDIVEIEDFKLLKPFAFTPDELRTELLKIKDTLQEDARKDLVEDTFLFGRGTADMKGGGAIQITLLERYSRIPDFKGNVIVIAVPDEENLSAGMRSGAKLLAELKEKYGLNYKLMINSEPHQRKDFSQGIFSEGSVGKIMPFLYVRGFLSHIGKVFEGFNPLNLMSEIVRRTELNMDMSDVVGGESAPPPTWLYLKDSKKHYDVSMPLSASGCFSILTLNQTPQNVVKKVRQICEEAFDQILEDMNASYKRFSEVADPVAGALPWKTKVVNFAELYTEASGNHGKMFEDRYQEKLQELSGKLQRGEINIIESNFELVEFVYDYIDDISPRIVYGLIPPYYPNVSNIYFDNLDETVKNLSKNLNQYTESEFQQIYTTEYFYTGISDLSYTSIKNSGETLAALEESMPLFGNFYNIPVEAIEQISMPCMNIGPWGKDFHKLTERVCSEDLFYRTPKIIHRAIGLVLNNPSLF